MQRWPRGVGSVRWTSDGNYLPGILRKRVSGMCIFYRTCNAFNGEQTDAGKVRRVAVAVAVDHHTSRHKDPKKDEGFLISKQQY